MHYALFFNFRKIAEGQERAPPLHKATDTMCTTPEAIQLPYNMLYKSIQDPITLPQQSNIDMLFNSYIDQQRNYNVQGISLLAHTTQ